jgi:hypothetical protein
MAHWLFYAGPENYLGASGERDFAAADGLWSGAAGVRECDLAVLYRRSLSRWSAEQMSELTGMSPEQARGLRERRIGSDIPLVWLITSGDQGPFNGWAHGFAVKLIASIEPPIGLKELRAEKRLRRWQDLRWNFRADGRDALEIPDFAWSVLREKIEQRLGTPITLLG